MVRRPTSASCAVVAFALVGGTFVACALQVSGVDGALQGGADGGIDASLAGDEGSAAFDASTGSDGALDIDAATCADGSVPCGAACIQTATDKLHCGSCTVACPGGDASCGAGVCSATLRVRGYVDDRSQLVLVGNHIHWTESHGAAPGRWQGADDPTYIDAVPWMPTWPAQGENRDCGCSSSETTVTPLAAKPQTLTITVVEGRGQVKISQQPDATNGYTAIIDISDSDGGAAWYEVLLGYETN